MKNVYSVFAEHIEEHIRKKEETRRPIEFKDLSTGICPWCNLTMYEIFDKE